MPLRGEGLGVVLDRAAEGGECFQGLSDFGGRSGLSDLHSAGNQVHGVVGMRGPHGAGDVVRAFDAIVFQDPIGQVDGTGPLVVDEGEGLDEIDVHHGQFFIDHLVQSAPYCSPMRDHGHAQGQGLTLQTHDNQGTDLGRRGQGSQPGV